jgi:hypothetical protein
VLHTKAGAPSFSRSVREGGAFRRHSPFRQPRYYDFNVRSEQKLMEKLDYMHQNPAQRGLVTRSEAWTWSSARHYATREEGAVEIESRGTGRRRKQLGVYPVIRPRDAN